MCLGRISPRWKSWKHDLLVHLMADWVMLDGWSLPGIDNPPSIISTSTSGTDAGPAIVGDPSSSIENLPKLVGIPEPKTALNYLVFAQTPTRFL